ncbi:MAG: sugar phosphate isomerase/epimerase family protein [Micromonosporaceae bacterium]
MTNSFRPGLCSVTYRGVAAGEVLRVAAEAGLRTIEWGGDVHAPPSDPVRLEQVRQATLAHGLTVASYGSYFRAGPHGSAEFRPVLAAAVALGAPRIRIWAGNLGTDQVDDTGARAVVARTRDAAALAAEHGVELGYEFHRNTLTDSVDATLRLLDAVDAPNVTTYWQPPVGVPAEDAVAGLARLRGRVCALHVFSWWPDTHRLPLADRADLWRAAFAEAAGNRPELDALLEFVPDDDPELLASESATLAALLGDR